MAVTDSAPPTVLITGAAGFIGSHLTELLLHSGHRVLGIDNLSTGTLRNLDGVVGHPQFHFAREDIANELVLDRLASQASIIIHLAAAVGVELIVRSPVHTIETNIMGTEAILKAALRYNCRVLIASTSEVYGKGTRFPFVEDDDVVLGPTCRSRWSYAASKMVDEFLGFAYHREYGLPVILVRFFNTVGPRQTGRYGMVVPRFVQWALRQEPLRVYGDGQQSRCFAHVSDVVRAVALLIAHPEAPGSLVNIGSTEEVSILQLAHRVRELANSTSEIVMVPYAEAYEEGFEDMRQRMPDISRVHRLIGWQPTKTLDDIIRDVISFERSRRTEPPESSR